MQFCFNNQGGLNLLKNSLFWEIRLIRVSLQVGEVLASNLWRYIL
ncbi:hypothetical protein FDUTEX481_10025 [Tolypothrix sp. PCC 7601]|nr:hypothetical protein FDUTEX481_10025 [Tolypothrix sp. PCC 7601]